MVYFFFPALFFEICFCRFFFADLFPPTLSQMKRLPKNSRFGLCSKMPTAKENLSLLFLRRGMTYAKVFIFCCEIRSKIIFSLVIVDALTLQMIRIMDKIWIQDGFDLKLKPYQVSQKRKILYNFFDKKNYFPPGSGDWRKYRNGWGCFRFWNDRYNQQRSWRHDEGNKLLVCQTCQTKWYRWLHSLQVLQDDVLLKWLKNKNPDDKSLQNAIEVCYKKEKFFFFASNNCKFF